MSRHVILGEDDRFLRRALETKLRQRGFQVSAAVDGEEVLALVRQRVPDLLLLDMLMPKLDGLGVLEALRADAATSGIRVVILSNSSRELEVQKATTLGVLDYWIKSNLSLQEICDRVDRLTTEATA